MNVEPSVTASMVSRYGYGAIDVRATYRDLPCQRFWTWLTGKALPSGPPRLARETLYPNVLLYCLEILKSYAIIAGSFALGCWSRHLLVQVVCVVLVMNRTRKMLHQFHYTVHGAALADMRKARFIAKYFLSLPILHTTWGEYVKIHARDHHAMPCTEDDPDQMFVVAHGFRPRMTARAFWFAVFVEPWRPKQILRNIAFRLRHNFTIPPASEVVPRALYWIALMSLVTTLGAWKQFALFFLLPLLVVTQLSSYYQHVGEHLWFAVRRPDRTPRQHIATLTWGRFLGRPYPRGAWSEGSLSACRKLLVWWLKVALVDLPCRVFFFMQDLSSHDFHHRVPGVCFRQIARERANREREPSSWGPMTESWSLAESILIQRDHLVKGVSEPFHWGAPPLWPCGTAAAAGDLDHMGEHDD